MQVLVVEDDRNLRRFLSKALREEGFGTVEVESGDRALDLALGASYSCIILDVMLPGRDGFDVVTELRSRSGARHLDESRSCAVPFADIPSHRVTRSQSYKSPRP